MPRPPEDFRIAYLRAEMAERGRQARERAAWGATVAWGTALGVVGSIAALLVG